MLLLVRFLRSRFFSQFWQHLHRVSLIGMNFWSSELHATGEIVALSYMASKRGDDPSPNIFDVGANVGGYANLCLKIFNNQCRIYAFEPSRQTFFYLKQSPELLGDHVTFVNTGLGDRSEDRVLYSSDPCSTVASLYNRDEEIKDLSERHSETIKLDTVDRFCERENIDKIFLLKLDIEGHELKALEGAGRMLRDRNIRFIQFEFGENNILSRTYMKDFNDLLEKYFRIFRVTPAGLIPWQYRGGSSEIFATMNYLCERRS